MGDTTDHSPLIYTVGHSNRSFEEFAAILDRFGIRAVADIRSIPYSRRFPHFNKKNLAKSLPQLGITRLGFSALGGLMKADEGIDSRNKGISNPELRAFADYMATDPFREAVESLLETASATTVAIMCAEALYTRCHRQLLSDFLLANGARVVHILDADTSTPHRLSEGAKILDRGIVVYP